MADDEEKTHNTKGSEKICDIFSCSPCLATGKTEDAQKFCVECGTYVCDQCVKDHDKFLALRSHEILDKSKQEPRRSKADDRVETNIHVKRCPIHHGNLIDRFCKEHRELCCESCVAVKHRSCKRVESLQVAAQDDYKNSIDYKESNEYIRNVMSKVRQEKANRKEYLGNLNREKEELLQSIQTYQDKIFDNIKIKVESSRQKILQAYGKYKAFVELDIAALDTVISTLDTYSQKLSNDDDDEDNDDYDAEKLFLGVQTGYTAANEGEWLVADLPSESEWRKSIPFSINFELEQFVQHSDLLTDDVEEACAFIGHMFIIQKILKGCKCPSLPSLISMLHLYLQPLTLRQSGEELKHDDLTDKSSSYDTSTDKFKSNLETSLKCNQCQSVTVYSKLVHCLSVPMRSPSSGEYRLLDVFWVPVGASERRVKLKLNVPKSGCVSDLCYAVSSYVNVGIDAMVVADVYNHRVHKVFAMSEPLSEIMDKDDIFVYKITVNDDSNQVVVPFYMREEKQQGSTCFGSNFRHELFGQPLLIAVPKTCSYNKLYDILLQRMSRFVCAPENGEVWWDANVTPQSEASTDREKPRKIFRFSCVNSNGTAEIDHELNDDGAPLNLHSKMYISINWCAVAKEKFYNEAEAEAFCNHRSMKFERPVNVTVNIVEYLKRLTAEETTKRYCQTCKKEQPTTLQTNLKSPPNRLITYLEESLSDSEEIFVDNLTGSLDLSKFVKNRQENCNYELTVVINNDGQNYTCYCKNIKSNTWYCLDKAGFKESTKEDVKMEKVCVLLFQQRE